VLNHGTTTVAIDGQLADGVFPMRRSRTNSTTRTPRTLLHREKDTTRLGGGLTVAMATTMVTRLAA
jgi:hypothetical protein